MERESFTWSISEKTEGMQDQKKWQWPKAGQLRWETEGLVCAAQEKTPAPKAIKNSIDPQDLFPLCRLCKEKVESVAHIVILCSVTAGNQYRKRHDKLRKKVYWLTVLLMHKWFSDQLEPVLENDKCKILWDFAIQADKEIEHQKSDNAVIEKDVKDCKIIDIAFLGIKISM